MVPHRRYVCTSGSEWLSWGGWRTLRSGRQGPRPRRRTTLSDGEQNENGENQNSANFIIRGASLLPTKKQLLNTSENEMIQSIHTF